MRSEGRRPRLRGTGLGRPGGDEPGQSLSGAEAQGEGVDGGELQAFVQFRPDGVGQLVFYKVEMGAVVLRRDGLQLGADVVGVEPEHEVGHKNHPFKKHKT